MKPAQPEDEYAIFISDIMSVLMVVFLFIAITFIQNVKKTQVIQSLILELKGG